MAYVSPDHLLLAPDCGMKYLSREAAFGKLSNMAEAGRQLRDEL
jgi:5-methyltetrahydropteroyltriglutamate--homocysteine methyltransferase